MVRRLLIPQNIFAASRRRAGQLAPGSRRRRWLQYYKLGDQSPADSVLLSPPVTARTFLITSSLALESFVGSAGAASLFALLNSSRSSTSRRLSRVSFSRSFSM